MQWKFRLEGTDELENQHQTELTIEKDLADVRAGKIDFSIKDSNEKIFVARYCEIY